jgi:hypothetical protein
VISPAALRNVLLLLALGLTLVAGLPAGSDGALVVAGNGLLYLVDSAGDVSPFARGTQGYADDAGAEAYLTVSTGHEVSGAVGGSPTGPHRHRADRYGDSPGSRERILSLLTIRPTR